MLLKCITSGFVVASELSWPAVAALALCRRAQVRWKRPRAPQRGSGQSRAQRLQKVHTLSIVEIGDDVEVGALTAIDRGTLKPTRIGSGTKIDDLVMIGHNVEIGMDCLPCGQVGRGRCDRW